MTITINKTIFMGDECWGWYLRTGANLVASGTTATEYGARYAAEMERRLHSSAERPTALLVNG